MGPERALALPVAEYVEPPSDRARFEQMLNRHHRKLRRLVAGVIADRDRVDDVLQEAYYRAYRRLPRHFANEAHEATWLFRVAYRCAIDELRSRKRRAETTFAEVPLVLVGAEPHRALVLDEAFRTLSPDERAVIVLVGVLGFDYETAAATLDVPRGTIASRLNSARRRLKAELGSDT